jgi:Aromatic acid exporter family member 2
LQVKKLGIVEAESSGQPYYPAYLFGPYKLLTVIAGCTFAFIWTVFPYPVTSRSQVRKLLGRGLFVLANFYSCMHTTIGIWIEGTQSDIQPLPHLLAETRRKLFSEEMTLITAMRTFSQFTVYEPPIGGKFPKSTYDSIISEIQSIVISMALMAKIPEGLDVMSRQQEQRWLHHLANVIDSTDFESHNITSLLCHLSAAVSAGTSLPPYLSPPEPFPVARKLRELNDGLLDRKNVQDPAFSAFASLEVLSSMVNKNLAELIR